MLPRNQRMELLSKAYVRAVIAQAGCIYTEPTPDFGIDFVIHDIAKEDEQYVDEGALLNMQLKSTTAAIYSVADDAYHYELDVATYNHLRKQPTEVPRLLVLAVMPKDEKLWLSQDNEKLILRHCAYYFSLQGRPPTSNKASITVSIPRQQVFSVDFLQHVIEQRKKR